MTNQFLEETLAKTIVDCIENAVGNDILEDIRLNELQTTNSRPSRIWDYINRNLTRTLSNEICVIANCHRGPWEMIFLYERASKRIVTIMREKRFMELRKNRFSRKKMHYLDMVAKAFNYTLVKDSGQQSLFAHTFEDENSLDIAIQKLLWSAEFETDTIANHVLILFETAGTQLTSVRAVMVTPDLEIAQNGEENWSQYISGFSNAVVETVDDAYAPAKTPSKRLSLTGKSRERQKKGAQIKSTKEAHALQG